MANIIVFAFHENRHRVVLARKILDGRKHDLEGFKGAQEEGEDALAAAARIYGEQGGTPLPQDRFEPAMTFRTTFEATEAYTVFLTDSEFHQVISLGGGQKLQVAYHNVADVISLCLNINDKDPGFPRSYAWAIPFMLTNQGAYEPLDASEAFDINAYIG